MASWLSEKQYWVDFPLLVKQEEKRDPVIYLDNAATTLKPTEVLSAMNRYYVNDGASVHRGMYKLAQQATDEYEGVRKKVAKFINADEEEVIFTHGATESLNQICLMISQHLHKGDEVITTVIDHHAAMLPWMHQQDLGKCVVKRANVDPFDYQITKKTIAEQITNRTRVLSLNLASNVVGVVQKNLKEVIDFVHTKHIMVIVDATQAIPHQQIDVKELGCDFLVFSGHKMLGPTGVGVLYGKKALLDALSPIYYGGDMVSAVKGDKIVLQEGVHRFEAGTPPIAEVIGLGAAIDYINSIGYDAIQAADQYFLDRLQATIFQIPGVVVYNAKDSWDIPIVSFNIKDVHSHDIITMYDEEGLCLRAGNHCAQPFVEWLGAVYNGGTLRASFYFYNKPEDMTNFILTTKHIAQCF